MIVCHGVVFIKLTLFQKLWLKCFITFCQWTLWQIWDIKLCGESEMSPYLFPLSVRARTYTPTLHMACGIHILIHMARRGTETSHTLCRTKQLNSLRYCTLNPNIGERFSSLVLLSSFVFCCARVCVCFLCIFSPTDARAAIFLLSPAATATGNVGDYVSSGRYCQLPGRWQHLHGGSSSLPSAVRLRCW